MNIEELEKEWMSKVRADIWQEAVARTQYVFGDNNETIQYLLAEVQAIVWAEEKTIVKQ